MGLWLSVLRIWSSLNIHGSHNTVISCIQGNCTNIYFKDPAPPSCSTPLIVLRCTSVIESPNRCKVIRFPGRKKSQSLLSTSTSHSFSCRALYTVCCGLLTAFQSSTLLPPSLVSLGSTENHSPGTYSYTHRICE